MIFLCVQCSVCKDGVNMPYTVLLLHQHVPLLVLVRIISVKCKFMADCENWFGGLKVSVMLVAKIGENKRNFNVFIKRTVW